MSHTPTKLALVEGKTKRSDNRVYISINYSIVG